MAIKLKSPLMPVNMGFLMKETDLLHVIYTFLRNRLGVLF